MPLAPKIRDNNPMLFMYAGGDKKSEEAAKLFHLEALVGKGDIKKGLRPLNDKYLLPIQNATGLSGVQLLGDNEKRGTEKNIMEFLDTIQQGRKSIVRRQRGFTSPYFIRLSDFGLGGIQQ